MSVQKALWSIFFPPPLGPSSHLLSLRNLFDWHQLCKLAVARQTSAHQQLCHNWRHLFPFSFNFPSTVHQHHTILCSSTWSVTSCKPCFCSHVNIVSTQLTDPVVLLVFNKCKLKSVKLSIIALRGWLVSLCSCLLDFFMMSNTAKCTWQLFIIFKTFSSIA